MALGTPSIAADDSGVPAKRLRLDSPDSSSSSSSSDSTPLTQEHIFKNLRLRRIVRENHSSTIAQLALLFYRPGDQDAKDEEAGHSRKHGTGGIAQYERSFEKRGGVLRGPEDNSNLLGTVGHVQANIYDNENCGDHLDIMSHYQLDHDAAAVFHTCCWVHSSDDALFAIAGEDKLVHIISLAWSREIRALRGHTDTIVDLQPHPADHSLLASVSKDGSVRIWSVLNGSCLCVYSCDATACRFHPDGKFLFTGSPSGEVRRWPVPSLSDHSAETLVFALSDSEQIIPSRRSIGSAIDCIRFANGSLLVKNSSGRIEHWDLESKSTIRCFSVRHHGINTSRFDVSYDDSHLCVGNSRGSVYIYDIESGKLARHLAHKRSVRPVTCCVFSRDCRSVIYTGEGGFIWRYDYVDDETLAEWEKPEDTTPDGSSSE